MAKRIAALLLFACALTTRAQQGIPSPMPVTEIVQPTPILGFNSAVTGSALKTLSVTLLTRMKYSTLVMACAAGNYDGTNIYTVSDTLGNSWIGSGTAANSSTQFVQMFWGTNKNGPGVDTVTFSYSGASSAAAGIGCGLYEIDTGGYTTNGFDTAVSNSSPGSSNISVGSLTPSTAGELVIAVAGSAVTTYQTAGTLSFDVSSAITGGGVADFATMSAIVPSTASYSCAMIAAGGSVAWAALCQAFKLPISRTAIAIAPGSATIGAVTQASGPWTSNITQLGGTTIDTNSGNKSAGTIRTVWATDQPNLTTPLNVQPVPATTGGLSLYNVEPGASDNHAVIKNGAGLFYHLQATNKGSANLYLRLYDAGTGFNGCNSATNLKYSAIIPNGTANGAGIVDDYPMGVTFGTGISICVTGAYGQTDTTNATASIAEVNVAYK